MKAQYELWRRSVGKNGAPITPAPFGICTVCNVHVKPDSSDFVEPHEPGSKDLVDGKLAGGWEKPLMELVNQACTENSSS